ncbi:RNA polymerase ECF-type sigma factor [Indibacter alkaliphilus LW1]|uniref:RNA polymerase ECF-type sigma factor n=1 Tax=Indibacter alkaliphilus (strain CCUG 57479 / KCTC 22604 / LW1) TaxID=1189612 RepID=S2CY32_INDAL|nr:RNA polymerase sigma-70 factor [Indibacter alkaliphilus]EOZ91499.1 RNA polymerase ECF-type sigma factor [Indibacter alkaliphilus LW1]
MLKPKISDSILCEGLNKKDKKSFDLIFERYWKRLYLYAYKIFQDQGICEDIVQEVFIKLWENAESNPINNLEGYLFRAVKFRISNAIRNLKNTSQIDDVLGNLPLQHPVDLDFEFQETNGLIHRSIESLPEKCREIFRLSREEHLSNREIAERLDISIRTVETQIYRALKVIRKNIGELYILFFFAFL